MALEIERKFLVTGEGWRQAHPLHLMQGYLNLDVHRTVRVRSDGGRAFVTIKGITTGATRSEFEYPIPAEDAPELLGLCEGSIIEKLRHIVDVAGARWEIDEFLGENTGLVVAEIELAQETQGFTRPAWLGREVTADPHYFNSSLATHPWRTWANPSGA